MTPSEIAKQLGSLGGKKTVAKYGKKHFSDAGKKSALKRWGKKEPLVTNEAKKNPLDMTYEI